MPNVEKIKHPCAEHAEKRQKNQIEHIEQKLLTAMGCVKQIHPTAIMWDMSSLKNKHHEENQLKVKPKESGKTFCEKHSNCGKVEKCYLFAQICFGVKYALMKNI